MKATGIVRRVDELGRLVIPKELRRTLGIKEGDPMEIFSTDEGIVLRPYRQGCTCCGSEGRLVYVKDMALCQTCVQAFVKEANHAKRIKGASD